MEILLDLNRRLGTGYQIRIMHGVLDKTFDEEPLTLYEAGAYAGTLLEEVNEAFGTKYKPYQVVHTTLEGLEANAKRDLASARMLQDIKSEKYAYCTPAKEDFRKTIINGKEDYLLSGRGVVLTTYFCWTDDKNEKARSALLRYCQYIATRGFKGGATKAMQALGGLDKDRAVDWIRQTYARYVDDDATLIAFLMNR